MKRESISFTPDDLFRLFIKLSYLLPYNTPTWLFSCDTLFYNSSPHDLLDTVCLIGYTLPGVSLPIKLFQQKTSLQRLNGNTFDFFMALLDEQKISQTLISSYSTIFSQLYNTHRFNNSLDRKLCVNFYSLSSRIFNDPLSILK